MYVDHCHQLVSSLFVVRQIGQKDFFILDCGTLCTSAESQSYKIYKNQSSNKNKIGLRRTIIFACLLIFDAQANPVPPRATLLPYSQIH